MVIELAEDFGPANLYRMHILPARARTMHIYKEVCSTS